MKRKLRQVSAPSYAPYRFFVLSPRSARICRLASSLSVRPSTWPPHVTPFASDPLLARHDHAGWEYRPLGSRVLELSAAVPQVSELREAVGPILARLALATQTTAFLWVYRHGQAICIERFHGNPPVQVSWWQIGGALPLHCGAAPRVLLAFLPEAEAEAMLARPLICLAPKGETRSEVLRGRLRRIRKRGWELSADDVAEGLALLGLPVRDRTGAVVAALSLGGLTPHLAHRGQPRFLRDALAATEEIAARLG